MRLDRSRRSGNVIDSRGRSGLGRGAAIGCGPLLIVLLGLLFGFDPSMLLALLGGGGEPVPQEQVEAGAPQDAAGDFVAAVMGEIEDTWRAVGPQAGIAYQDPTIQLYDGMVQSACGVSGAATGPFYCPLDQRIYLDLSFFRELERFGASGDFAVAYVIAHEFGHHIQNLEGTLEAVQSAQRRLPEGQANELSVRTELQADCYAGVWAFHSRDILEAGDVEEGLAAAAAVGDDHLTSMAGQAVSPDSFTHGTSAQRTDAFRTGLASSSPAACDTFADLRR